MSMIDIYIRDKDSGIVRRVGDDHHDMLTINKHGQLCYYNLQNGGGCRTGEEPQDWYEFVPNEDEYGDATDPREDGKSMIEYIHSVEEETYSKMPDSIKEYVEERRIVRCKDCKHWHEWQNRTGSCHRSENGYNWFGVDSNDYCSFGERREE